MALSSLSRIAILAMCLALFAQNAVGQGGSGVKYGSLAWSKVPGGQPFEVEFELVLALRKDFRWPRKQGSHNDPIRPGDVIRVSGLSFESDGGDSIAAGQSDWTLHTGDGSMHQIDLLVTGESNADNLIMTVGRVRHVYSSAYHSKQQGNWYPVGHTFAAGPPSDLAANAPFRHVPFEASWSGCCRDSSLQNSAGKPFRLFTTIDLTDANGSPAVRMFPIVTVPLATSPGQGSMPKFRIPSKDLLLEGGQQPVAKSGGDSNFPSNDNKAAPPVYSLLNASSLGLPSADFSQPTFVSLDSASGVVSAATWAGSGVNSFVPGDYAISFAVSAGSGKSTAFFVLRVINSTVPSTVLPATAGSHLGAQSSVPAWVGYSVDVKIELRADFPLALRMQLSSLALGRASNAFENTMMLPVGAQILSINEEGRSLVTDIALAFDNPATAHSPGIDASFAMDSQQFVNNPSAANLSANGFSVVDRNINDQAGGLYAYLWTRSAASASAITDILVTVSSEQELAARGSGYQQATQDVNAQAGATASVKIWIRRGGSAPITNITVSATSNAAAMQSAGWIAINGNLNAGTQGTAMQLFMMREGTSKLVRTLRWTPREAGQFVFVFSAVPADSTSPMPGSASVMSSVAIGVRSDPAPAFDASGSTAAVSATMGLASRWIVRFQDHANEQLVFAPSPSTQRWPEGVSIVGSQTSNLPGGLKAWDVTVEWRPTPKQGGFQGPVCVQATDQGGESRAVQHTEGCVSVSVQRCIWGAQAGDSLGSVANTFGARSWLQVWHFNPQITHPDFDLMQGSKVNIGRVYESEPNDTLGTVARRFSTSEANLVALNFGVQANDIVLPQGTPLCVIPDSCTAAPTMPI